LGSRRAATGVRNDRGARPQAVEDHDRRSRHRRPLTWGFSRVFPGPQHHAVPCSKAQCRSRTEEVRGSNPLTSTPTSQVRASPASSRRRSLHVAAALRPQAQVTVQPRGSQRPADPGPASQGDHAAWSPPAASRWAILAPIPSLSRSAARSAGPVLTTSHNDDQVQVDPPLAQQGLRQLRAPGSNLGQTTRCHGHGGRPRRSRPSQAVRLPAPPPHPVTSLPLDTADVATHRHRTLDTWTLRRPHRTPVTGQAPSDTGRSHQTLGMDAGHERGHGDDSTAGIRISWPPRRDGTLRCAPVLCPHTTRQPLGRSAGQAAPRRTAVVCWIWMVREEGNETKER
jgi:hypothetical protein